MGVENNEAIIAVSWDDKSVSKAKKWIGKLSDEEKSLFAIVPALVNGKTSIILAPDGSKKGWDTANQIEALRNNFVEFIENSGFYFEWVEVGFGEYGQKVLRGNNANCYGDTEYA